MNNETKAQLQAISDNVLNLNYDEILFRADILLRSIELITLIKRIEPEGSVAKFKNQIQGL